MQKPMFNTAQPEQIDEALELASRPGRESGFGLAVDHSDNFEDLVMGNDPK